MMLLRSLSLAALGASLWLWTGGAVAQEYVPAADEATLRDAGLKTDGPALLDFFRKRTLSDADKAKLAGLVRKLGDPSFKVREQASASVLTAGRNALPFLRSAVKDPDLEIARRAQQCVQAIESGADAVFALAAARLLAIRRPQGTVDVILRYLPFADDESLEDELLAALAAVGVRDGKAESAILAGLQDSLPVRRAAAAWIVGRSADREQRLAAKALLTDRDAKVRLRAAQGLLAGKEKVAIPALIAVLGDSPVPLAGQAEELLCHIAGDQAPQVSLGTGASEERRQSREAWTGWWRRNEATLDLAKLDLQQRMLGLNLIVVCDTLNNGIGRVWEIRADAKPRWEINDANYPVDGEMLPRNRVLIAEQRANRVTERNSQGKVLWEYQANTSLVSCHRLANGNTFIATYNELMEITPDKKKIVSHVVSQATVYSAQKLRNGHYACYLSNGHLIELDEKGKQVRNFKVGTHKVGLVKFEVLPGGRFLVPNQEAGKILEMDGAGKVLWECAAANVNSVQRLPNGNLLACSWQDRRVFELNRAGTIVWEHRVGGGPLRIQRR